MAELEVKKVQQRVCNYLSGRNTICPSNEDFLLHYVSTNQISSLSTLVQKNAWLLSYDKFAFPYNGDQILTIACNRKMNVKEDTVQELINLGANIDFNHGRALHVAVVNPNSSILRVLIRNKCNVNAISDSNNTALQTLIKHLRDDDEDDENSFVEHVKLLLAAGIDVNRKDNAGVRATAIAVAAKSGFKSIVTTLLDESQIQIDLDNCVLGQRTAEEWITKKKLYDLTAYKERKFKTCEKSPKDVLFELIKEQEEDKFIEMFGPGDKPDGDDGTKTYLQYSCDKNCFEIVKFLCEKDSSIIEKTVGKAKKPLGLALEHGYHRIVDYLVKEGAKVDGELLSYAIKFTKFYDSPYKDEHIDREKCLEILMKSGKFEREIINEKDGYGNTPLNNAVMWGPSGLTETLLERGANLGIRNNLDFMPIQFINPKTLEKHLDDCIEIEKLSHNVEDNKITLKLDTFIPEAAIIQNESFSSVDCEKPLLRREFERETTVINHMANSPELKHLLKHPVIVCFLMMKWHRIRCLFYTNVTFYAIFVLSLNTYIFMKYANFDSDAKSGPYENVVTASFVALFLTYLLLWLRELFQFVVSPKKYLHSFENFVEICLLLITSVILFDSSATNDVKKQVSAFAIVFSAFELVLMLGQYPRFTTHVIMFKTVSANFVQLFLWYSLLIIAFALSFNVLFTKSDTLVGSKTNSSSGGKGDDDDDVFTGPGPSLFKTLVMLTGEYDASSIDFHTYPVVSRLIFTMFVFTITIILLNLLNGLAVSDTQTIKNDAELVGYIARAKLINYFETLFIGNVLENNRFFNYVKSVCCCCANQFSFIGISRHFLTRKLCLFPISQEEKGKFKIIFMTSYAGYLTLNDKLKEDGINCCNNCVADKATIQRAKNIAQKNKTVLVSDFEQLKAEHNILKQKLDEVLDILKNKKCD